MLLQKLKRAGPSLFFVSIYITIVQCIVEYSLTQECINNCARFPSDPPRIPEALNEKHTCKLESEGKECIVKVVFDAHPKPFNVEWKRFGENLDSEKYKTFSEVEMRTVRSIAHNLVLDALFLNVSGPKK
jgi:hypothetical protein